MKTRDEIILLRDACTLKIVNYNNDKVLGEITLGVRGWSIDLFCWIDHLKMVI
jgi:hypothetical protein